MLMLRCALVMLLSSLLQNGTLANSEEELSNLHEWAHSCYKVVHSANSAIPHELKTSLSDSGHLTQMSHTIGTLETMLKKMNTFSIEGMDELLKGRLQEPLQNAINICKKCEKVKQSGLKKDKNVFVSFSSNTHSQGIDKDTINTLETMLKSMNTFPIEGMDELLKRRLQEPLQNAINNCKKCEKVKQSGLKKDKNVFVSFSSNTHSQGIDKDTINTLETMLKSMNTFPIGGMDELLKRRLQEPLQNAINNCKKCEKVKQSGLKKGKKDLESSSSKIHLVVQGIDKDTINTFEKMLERVKKFPIEGMDELLKRRLQEPLENAINICKKYEKVKQSGLKKDKKDLESEIRSFGQGFGEELDTFITEVKQKLTQNKKPIKRRTIVIN